MATAFRDVRYAMRMLRARPGFAAVTVITLALGVGANTAIFSVVRALLLDPLPFPQPDRLVMMWEHTAGDPQDSYTVSAPNYLDWQRGVKAFEQTGIWEPLTFNFSGDGGAERVPGIRTSASTFAMLGVKPQLGRTFTSEEDAPGHDVAVISDGLWRRRFGARPRHHRPDGPHQRQAVRDHRRHAGGVQVPEPRQRRVGADCLQRPGSETQLAFIPVRRPAARRRDGCGRRRGAGRPRTRAGEAVPQRQPE